MVLCAAPNCKVKGGMGVRLYNFPVDHKLCKTWVEKLKKVNFWPSKHSKLCERHFTKDSFTMDPEPAKSVGFCRIALKKGAFPSIFDYNPLKSPMERRQTLENERPEPGPPAAKIPRRYNADLKTCAPQPESSHQDHPGKQGTPRIKNAFVTVSSENSLNQHASWSQPTAAKVQKRTESQFENQYFENREHKVMTHSVQSYLPAHTQMQIQQHSQVAAPLPAPAQPAPTQEQVLGASVQVAVVKPKPVEKLRPREKRLFVVAGHQRCVMSNLASLWKSGKLCDAGIGNGSSTVMMHKLVLSAMCPKLLSAFDMDIKSHEFLQVNFPREVSTEALNAFAEYMYNGILDLDHDILEQLKIIAKRLDMKDFEQLCDSRLPNHIHQPVSVAAATTDSLINVPLIQTTIPIHTTTSSHASIGSTISTSVQSMNTPVTDIKQEISEDKPTQVKMEAAAVFSQESEVASNESGNASGFVIRGSIKTEPVGPEDDKYGHWSSSSNNQAFTSTTSSSLSSSIAEAATASTSEASPPQIAVPPSKVTDVKSTRLKATHSYEAPLVPDLSPFSSISETVHTTSSSMNKDSSKPSSQSSNSLFSVDVPKSNDVVYPVRLFTARGDNLPLLTTHSSDAMTVNLFVPSEKT